MWMRQGCIAVLAAAAAFAQAKEPAPKTSKPEAQAARKTVTLPAGAVEISPGLFKHTAADGKAVLYRKTPFGLVIVDESAVAAGDAGGTPRANPFGNAGNSVADTMSAVEEGDSIRFERKTPFGPQKWTTKKSDLTPDEQAAWQAARERKASSAPDAAGTGKGPVK